MNVPSLQGFTLDYEPTGFVPLYEEPQSSPRPGQEIRFARPLRGVS